MPVTREAAEGAVTARAMLQTARQKRAPTGTAGVHEHADALHHIKQEARHSHELRSYLPPPPRWVPRHVLQLYGSLNHITRSPTGVSERARRRTRTQTHSASSSSLLLRGVNAPTGGGEVRAVGSKKAARPLCGLRASVLGGSRECRSSRCVRGEGGVGWGKGKGGEEATHDAHVMCVT